MPVAASATRRKVPMPKLTNKHRWFLVAGAAGLAASQVTKHALTASWRLAAGKSPPDDPGYDDVEWPRAIAFTAAAGAVVALAELLGRQGAARAWKLVTGKRAPRARRRHA
jgi:uncharacterized protein DUF4235